MVEVFFLQLPLVKNIGVWTPIFLMDLLLPGRVPVLLVLVALLLYQARYQVLYWYGTGTEITGTRTK